jgi:hypothetical protein
MVSLTHSGKEPEMSTPLLFAVVCAALPAGAAQDGADTRLLPANGALPARAATVPTPERSTLAPAKPVASHVMTPSLRAMEQARAKAATAPANVDKTTHNQGNEQHVPDAPPANETTLPAQR